MKQWSANGWWIWALAVAAVGCNVPGPEIDRVQVNLVDKAIFEGEWWATQTVLDVDADSAQWGLVFQGDMPWADLGVDKGQSGTIARIRWVIDQNYLFAYRAYELVDGGNNDGDSPDFRGQPLAAFRIEAHIDVRQDYNPLTGEETRVRIENASDRRWYERQFMRVDWSQNLISSFYYIEDYVSDLYGMRRESAPFFIPNEDSHPDFPPSWAPQFVRVGDDPSYRFAEEWDAEDADTVHYMSFVNMQLISPGAACLMYGLPCQTYAVPIRLAFLRVPPKHEYASAIQPHWEYDRFGVFRTYQRTYVRGGRNEETLGRYCERDEDCGAGGACDTGRKICVGGLTEDFGETDLLTFYRPRFNFFKESFRKDASGQPIACVADWQCNDVRGLGVAGSECDRAAGYCTIPFAERETRQVVFHLNEGFPAHLVPAAFQVMGDWNEVFMRGWRAARGQDLPDYSAVRLACQGDDPTRYCYCNGDDKAPEVAEDGTCTGRYDPFVPPAEWEAMGVVAPYDCYVKAPEGFEEPAHPRSFDEYPRPLVYHHEFVGEECLFVLEANTCDKVRDDASVSCDELAARVAEEGRSCQSDGDCGGDLTCVRTSGASRGTCRLRWEQLGDIRYQFFNYVSHGNVPFCGVSLVRSDPTNGEMLLSNANMGAECTESVGTMALEYFPVLRGELAEDAYVRGENVRGYFSRLGRTERRFDTVPSGEDGYQVEDQSRPAIPVLNVEEIRARIEEMRPRLEALRGREGRFNLMSDRLQRLKGSAFERALVEQMATRGRGLLDVAYQDPRTMPPELAARRPGELSVDERLLEEVSPVRGALLRRIRQMREQEMELGARGYDPPFEALFQNRYWQYWADKFAPADGEGFEEANKEAQIRMEQAMLRAVMWHEVGHSVGLRHNFAASLDRNNYHDPYFDIVVGDATDPTDDLPLPNVDAFDADADGSITGDEYNAYLAELRRVRNERAARGLSNTMTASIMEYNGDTSDMIYGLGKYDVAATLYNHFDMVEAYTGDPRYSSAGTLDGLELSRSTDTPRAWFRYYAGGESCQVDSDCPFNGLREQGQPVFQRCVQNLRTVRRPEACGSGDENCICSNFDMDFEDYVFSVPPYDSDQDGNGEVDYFPVRYLFCGDRRTNDISWCTRFDAGESFQEVIDHYRRRWEEGYPLNYYRRFRRSGPRRGAAWGYIIDAAKIYQHLLFRLFFEAGFSSNRGPLGLADQYQASIDAMNWLTELVHLPDEGAYRCNDLTGVCERVSSDPDAPGADFSFLPGQGFAMWSEYQEGIRGFFRVERAGVFWDKFLALYALALRDWGLSFGADERYFINFYDFFNVEMTEFFGGLIQNDPMWFAPRVMLEDDGPKVVHLSWVRGSCTGPTGRVPCRGSQEETYPVDPTAATPSYVLGSTTNEVLRNWATMLALAEFPVFYDTSFQQRLVVFKLDSGEGYDVPVEIATDGTPCSYSSLKLDPSHDSNCSAEDADYIIYESDRLHMPYVAVKVRPRLTYNLEEEQLGFQLLRKLEDNKRRIQQLEAMASRSPEEEAELRERKQYLFSNESFLDYLINLARMYGISNFF